MSRIFLSHSSVENGPALALRDWLVSEGWDDLFLDLDPERGIAGGERWERELNQAAHRCEAVLFLVSRAWLKSAWCMKEFHLATKLNKRIFGVLIEDIAIKKLPRELTATWQMVDLAKGSDHAMFKAVLPGGQEQHVTFSKGGLAQLKRGLTRAGLDPRFFAWPPDDDPDRPPYRGLRPLEAEDAGIFFGREAPVIETLDRLRGLREAAPPRFLAILGASGAGKSSFLRAGLVPRLARDDRNFVILPVIRPERAVISGETGLLRSLTDALAAKGFNYSRAEIKKAVATGSEAVLALLGLIAEKASMSGLGEEGEPKPPAVILAIDQGEELFQAEGAEESLAFLSLARDLVLTPSPNLIVIVTIRSDSYERLQSAPALEGIRQQTLSLPPLPRGAYQTVIEGPANRLKDTTCALRIEPQLSEALMADIEAGGAKDALPLLAFTLERLYLEHGGDGDLRLVEYREIGGIRGSIEAAVEQVFKAADLDPAIPKDHAARLALLRRAFIPWLAGIDPATQSPRRAIARLSEIPEEARPLVRHLIDQHLLSTDMSQTGEQTVEPAHEALLRQWSLLEGWLEEDFAQLSTLDGVKRAARDWLANGKAEGWLAHSTGRLEDAEALQSRPDLAAKLAGPEREYLTACRAAETAHKDRELEEARKLADAQKKIAGRTRIGLIAASLLAVIALAGALYGLQQATKARQEKQLAEEQRRIAEEQTRIAETRRQEAEQQRKTALLNEGIALSGLASTALAKGNPADALKLALAAWPRSGDPDRPALERSIDILAEALPQHHERLRLALPERFGNSIAFSPDGTRILTTASAEFFSGGDYIARLWDAKTGDLIAALGGDEHKVKSAVFSPDGTLVATSEVGGARLWDAKLGSELVVLPGREEKDTAVEFSPDGTRVLTTTGDGAAQLWDTRTGIETVKLRNHELNFVSAEYSPDGLRVVNVSNDQRAWLWDAKTGVLLAALTGRWETTSAVLFSPDGTRIATVSDRITQLWNAKTGTSLVTLRGHRGAIKTVDFSPDGMQAVTVADDGTARLWNAQTGTAVAVFKESGDFAVFSPDGLRILTGSGEDNSRLWDAKTGAEVAMLGRAVLVNSSLEIAPPVFSPDSTHIVAMTENGNPVLWDAKTGTEILTLKGGCPFLAAVFSADSATLATVCGAGTARLWDAKMLESTVLQRHEGKVTSAVFSSDGSRVLTQSDDKKAWLWDAKTKTLVTSLTGRWESNSGAFFSPDGTRVITISDGVARLWDARVGTGLVTLRGHDGTINTAGFSSDGLRVATASDDKTVRLWDATTGAEIKMLMRASRESIGSSVAFSPDGSWIATTDFGDFHIINDDTVRIWNATTGAEITTFGEGNFYVAFSPDGTRVLTRGGFPYLQGARVWDVRTGKEITILPVQKDFDFARFSPDGTRVVTFEEFGDTVLWDADTGAQIVILKDRYTGSVTFSPDGARLVTMDRMEETLTLWSSKTGVRLAELKGHRSLIDSTVFSPDGARVLTASADSTARLWDGMTGVEIAVLKGHEEDVTSAVFSPDGGRVLTASKDKTVRLWNVSAVERGDAFTIACKRLGNNIDLTDVRERYGLGPIAPICGDHPPFAVDPSKLQ